jgi:tetratricopeptide (TPR) repeat protein
MPEEQKGIQDLYFPNRNYRENAKFPNILAAVENLNFKQAVSEFEQLKQEDRKSYLIMSSVIKNFLEPRKINFSLLFQAGSALYENIGELGFYFQAILDKNSADNEDVRKYADLLLQFSIAGVVKIQDEAKGYPDRSINGMTWLDGACIDVWNDFLANYFDIIKDYKNYYNSRLIQSRIVFAIKRHYSYEIARSTYNMGLANSKIGEMETALKCFQAVVDDFQEIIEEPLDYFMENMEAVHELYYLGEALEKYIELEGHTDEILREQHRKVKELERILKTKLNM